MLLQLHKHASYEARGHPLRAYTDRTEALSASAPAYRIKRRGAGPFPEVIE